MPPGRSGRGRRRSDTRSARSCSSAPVALRVGAPRGMTTDSRRGRWSPPAWAAVEGSREPRLVPEDAEARAVYRRPETQGSAPGSRVDGLPGLGEQRFQGGTAPERKDIPDDKKKEEPPPQPRQPVPTEGLEFVGKASKTGEVKLLLLYPRESTLSSLLGRLQPGP